MRDLAPPRQRYVAFVRAADRPGSLTAVAEVMSSRGVSIESFRSSARLSGTAMLTLVFSTSARLERLIERTLARLAAVSDVTVLPADAPRVRAVGVVHAAPGRRFIPPGDAAVTWSGDTSLDQPLLIEGTLVDVEKVLAAAVAEGAALVSSIVLPP
ncbi:hypothetical protein [Propionicimonas sp.]|uniref:hypothetical protein n=1 Tax=Propionicimonas sp. TaxID=1955623 RepID=UPI0039E54CA4